MTEHTQLTAPARLEVVRTLPGTIERVWDFLTQSDLRAKWLCAGDVEPWVGGKITFAFDHRRLSDQPAPDKYKDQEVVTFEGKVLIYDRPHTLAFSWPEQDGAGTKVTMTLEAVDGGVRLHLIHENLTKPEHRDGAAAGWHVHLDLLDDVLGGRPVRDFWAHYMPMEDAYRKRFKEKPF